MLDTHTTHIRTPKKCGWEETKAVSTPPKKHVRSASDPRGANGHRVSGLLCAAQICLRHFENCQDSLYTARQAYWPSKQKQTAPTDKNALKPTHTRRLHRHLKTRDSPPKKEKKKRGAKQYPRAKEGRLHHSTRLGCCGRRLYNEFRVAQA